VCVSELALPDDEMNSSRVGAMTSGSTDRFRFASMSSKATARLHSCSACVTNSSGVYGIRAALRRNHRYFSRPIADSAGKVGKAFGSQSGDRRLRRQRSRDPFQSRSNVGQRINSDLRERSRRRHKVLLSLLHDSGNTFQPLQYFRLCLSSYGPGTVNASPTAVTVGSMVHLLRDRRAAGDC
jgi:hypothetical protein